MRTWLGRGTGTIFSQIIARRPSTRQWIFAESRPGTSSDAMRNKWCVAICFAAACNWLGEMPCGNENLLTTSKPSVIESFEVRDDRGAVLWKIHATTPRDVRSISLGEVPEGFVQTIPEAGRPRDFGTDEELVILTVSTTHTLRHKGVATGPRSFCGGFYESTPRPLKSEGDP